MKLTRRLYEAIRTWDDAAKPPRIADLERALHLSKRDRWALKGALRELQDRGAVRRLKGGRYTLESRDKGGPSVETRRGVYKHKAAGYGFVDTGKPGGGIFIPPGKNGSAMDRDTVEVEVYPGRRGKGPEGRVRRVVQRNRELVTGTALRLASEWILEPDDPGLGLSIDLEDPRKDLDDLSVVAEIIRFPSSSEESPLARVKEVLGPPGHLDTESRKILYMGAIHEEFPEEALAEAQQRSEMDLVVESSKGLERRDLRELPFMTIDPSDARDFDDAVYAEIKEDGTHRLWVAIADVSHFVVEGGDLDEEAQRRGFSVYLPHRAVPMLPESLSSVACSLTPREDRFAMVVAMDIDYKGGSKPHWMGPALINSKARLDYELVARLLSGEPAVRKELGEPITSQVFRLKDLTDLLLGKRRRRGMLELSTAEPKVVLAPGEELKVDDVVRQKHSKWVQKAYGLVEQCMLEANETVGAYMDACGAAVPWRIHPEADGEKLERFAELLKLLGREKLAREIDASKPSSKELAKVGRRLKDLPQSEAEALSPYLLTCLMQATYSFENEGHFALAAETYLHFTSPIRRYPDLMVHRALKEVLEVQQKGKDGATNKPSGEELEAREELAVSLSERERQIMEVERQAVDLFSAALMEPLTGEEFEGTVHTVMPFGAFVRLDHPYVEGLIRFTGDDDWEDDGTELFVVARRSGRRLGPASRVTAQVSHVSLLRRQIELDFGDGESED